ncbi:MAG: putative lipid II flippase FtsW [Deltaproteobacteria bacterium]|nr:putative lipid II flippase FtsW [Deltaproteobacteria bacterium]
MNPSRSKSSLSPPSHSPPSAYSAPSSHSGPPSSPSHGHLQAGGADLLLLGSMMLLVMVGVVMIFSASALLSDRLYGSGAAMLRTHLIHLTLGMAALGAGFVIPYSLWREWIPQGLLAGLVLLALVLIPGVGHNAGGASRWLRLGGFSFQPVEWIKPLLMIYTAAYLARRQGQPLRLDQGLLPLLLVVGVCLGLLLLQPDFGSMVLLGTTVLLMLFVAGADSRHLAGLGGGFLVMGIVLVATKGYRLERVLTFLDPWQDRLGSGFQVVQSFLAFGNGGWLGMGIGASKQKMFFLPDAHTDFIFSILAEETGLLGAWLVMGLLALFLWRGFQIASRCPDAFGRLLAFGLTTLLAIQTLINLGVVMGLMPTKGLPLPFISYGGSALMGALFMGGVLLNISRWKTIQPNLLRRIG